MTRRQLAELLRRQALGALVGRVAELSQRLPGALAHVGPEVSLARPPRSASEPASVLRRCAKAPCTTARPPGQRPGPRRRSPSSTESTLGTGRNTLRDTGRSTLTSQANWASTDGTP